MARGKAWEREKVIEVLRPFFQLGYSVTMACKLVGIPQPTVAGWLKNDEELRLKIGSWQGMVSVRARQNMAKSITTGNIEASKWWLERREKEDFSLRSELSGAEGGPIVIIDAGKSPYNDPEGQKLLPSGVLSDAAK